MTVYPIQRENLLFIIPVSVSDGGLEPPENAKESVGQNLSIRSSSDMGEDGPEDAVIVG